MNILGRIQQAIERGRISSESLFEEYPTSFSKKEKYFFNKRERKLEER